MEATAVLAQAVWKWRCCWSRLRLVSSPHSCIMPGKWSKRNLDPSRGRAAAGTPVAGRDDRAGLPRFVGGGGWRSAAVWAVPPCDKRNGSTVVPDHSAHKSRKPPGTPRV